MVWVNYTQVIGAFKGFIRQYKFFLHDRHKVFIGFTNRPSYYLNKYYTGGQCDKKCSNLTQGLEISCNWKEKQRKTKNNQQAYMKSRVLISYIAFSI